MSQKTREELLLRLRMSYASRSQADKPPFKLLGFDCDNGTEFLNRHQTR